MFGEGRPHSPLALVGEQPGDQEDKQGHPFVGPAGHVLDRALHDSGIERADAYVTNAVKHFKWEARGKRRIHQRPNGTEIMACRGWLEAGAAVVEAPGHRGPGRGGRGGDLRPRVQGPRPSWPGRGRHGRRVAGPVLSTVHPSSILRAGDDQARAEALAGFVADLVKAREGPAPAPARACGHE